MSKYNIISQKEEEYHGGVNITSIIEFEGKYYNVNTSLLYESGVNDVPLEYYETAAFRSDENGKWLSANEIVQNKIYIEAGTEFRPDIYDQVHQMHKDIMQEAVDEERMGRDEYEMKKREEERRRDSKQYLRKIDNLSLTDQKLDYFSRRHTKEFIMFLQKQSAQHPNNPNYNLIKLMDDYSATSIIKSRVGTNSKLFFKINPALMYNREYAKIANIAIDGLAYKPQDLDKLEELPLTIRQRTELYDKAIDILAKGNYLHKVDLPQEMIERAKIYVEKNGGSIKQHYDTIDSSKRFISFGMTSMPEDFKPIKNTSVIKPRGGIFACEYREGERGNHSDWEAFCIREQFKTETLKEGMVFSISPTAKVLTIDSMDDIRELLSKYENQNMYGLNHLLHGIKFATIDFESIATKYDVINITEGGQLAFDVELGNDLNYINSVAWDVPQLIICNPNVIQNIEPFIADELDIKVQQGYDLDDEYEKPIANINGEEESL